jgi:membrane protein implicated in regulation of membrane protease activity
MWASLKDLRDVLGAHRFWSAVARLTIFVSVAVVVLFVAMSAMILLLPLALVVGLALHLYVRRALRQAARRPRRGLVIEGEYAVLERR